MLLRKGMKKTMKLFDCTGKVTMVTGGNSGLGLGFAMGPAKMGGDVAIWARNADKNEKAKDQLLAKIDAWDPEKVVYVWSTH